MQLSTNLSLKLNSSAESKLDDLVWAAFCSFSCDSLWDFGCAEEHVRGHVMCAGCDSQDWLTNSWQLGWDSLILGVDLSVGSHVTCDSWGETGTCTWGKGCQGAYLSSDWPRPVGKGLDEAEREPVAECMAESTEMVMGAERRSAASVRGFVAAWSSSSRSSSREEWSGNSWCLKRNEMVGDRRIEKA